MRRKISDKCGDRDGREEEIGRREIIQGRRKGRRKWRERVGERKEEREEEGKEGRSER